MKCIRTSLAVEAVPFELGKGLEDGFHEYSKIVTNGLVTADNLVSITDAHGVVKCPYIRNKRGVIFIRKGDYIITEGDGERHVCGADKFPRRFEPI